MRACLVLTLAQAASVAVGARLRLTGYIIAPQTVRIAPSNSSLYFSPYTWNVTDGAATTVNTGAYMRTLFSGNSVALTFDVSAMVSPPSQIMWRVDDGPLTATPVAGLVPLVIPPAAYKNGDLPFHFLEFVVKSTTETANRWLIEQNSVRVVFTGLVLDAGAGVAQAFPAPKNVLIYGDSITEGVRTIGESAPFDTDRNDVTVCWSFRQAALLGAEVGIVGFGATGLSRGGSGNVPALGSTYNMLWATVPRSFLPNPDLIVLNEGTNDGSADIVEEMTAVLNGLLTACPGTPIAVMRPFNGAEAANLRAAIAASSDPGLCNYIDTTGFFQPVYGADSMSLHPSGPNDVGRIAPQVAALLRPLL
jgi:hypothetical protein